MRYKTILVHADLSRHASARLAMAVALAQAHQAHLIGVAASGVAPLVYPPEQVMLPGAVLDPYVGARRTHMEAALQAFDEAAREGGVSHESRLICDHGANALASLARFVDLVVLSQDDPDETIADADWRLPEFAVLHGARPVLVMPAAAVTARAPACILVAWNGSLQATAALGHALPLLRQASKVLIAAFPEHHGTPAALEDADPLLHYLDRHAITARFEPQVAAIGAGQPLLELARKQDAELIVMGCYGHARVREACLGGVSRTMLRSAPIALLMAHA